MSVINKMLRELDQRHAMSVPAENAPPKDVRPVRAARRGRDWFWRLVAALMLAAVAWMGWAFYQVQPRPVATDVAIAAGEKARLSPPAVMESKAVEPAPVSVNTESEKPPTESAAFEKLRSEPAVESLKLAHTIETPIPEQQVPAAENAPRPKAAAPALKREGAASNATGVKLEKREITPTQVQRADTEFRRGAGLLQQGRVSEAEEYFRSAIALHPRHESARQTLAALLIEQRRLEEARKLLQEGISFNPGQAQFAAALARIHVERGNYPAALEVLNASRSAGQSTADLNLLLGSVLQRSARHREAAEAYQAALRLAPEQGTAWIGLAISLEALERREEAVEAYKRALANTALTAEVRTYAEQKLRQLRGS